MTGEQLLTEIGAKGAMFPESHEFGMLPASWKLIEMGYLPGDKIVHKSF
jgi:hypothetical protein